MIQKKNCSLSYLNVLRIYLNTIIQKAEFALDGITRRSLRLKGTLHSVEKNPYTEGLGLLCLLLHSEGTAIFFYVD